MTGGTDPNEGGESGKTRVDLRAFLGRAEGQHFDRKSLFHGPEGQKKTRDRRVVRDQIAQYVAAFANAEGGVLLLGIEDDGRVTGHSLPAHAVDAMLNAPKERLEPPQPVGFRGRLEGVEVLAFEIPMASTPVQVTGGGYPLRMGDQCVAAGFEKIQALKVRGLMESFEAKPSALALEDLDAGLMGRAMEGAGLSGMPAATYLVRRRLADLRGSTLILRQAAELLFAPGLPEHPNAGVRIFRVVGRERLLGRAHNVEELPRVEGALPQVVAETFKTVDGLLRRPSRLQADGTFQPTSEVPEFSWKEAVLNAVAHRDYGVMGRGVEVWLFDDRMEITSPGPLVEGVTLDGLLTLDRVHMSRNPRLVRALVDLGYMRDQGEGIPRMFWEMEAEMLPAPQVEADGYQVRVTLQNAMAPAPQIDSDRGKLNTDRGELDLDRGELGTDLNDAERASVAALGARPRKEKLRAAIMVLAQRRAWTATELTAVLGRSHVDNLTERHLKPMVAAGRLQLTYPGILNHPEQGYEATGAD